MCLANENFPRPSVNLIRDQGYEIISIQEQMPGIPDEVVLQKAIIEHLIILTFDRDYGELIFRYAQANPPSVIYFREKGNDPLFAGQLLLALLSEGLINFKNSFTVVEEHNIRQRFYK